MHNIDDNDLMGKLTALFERVPQFQLASQYCKRENHANLSCL